MPNSRYLVVGGGMTGDAACRGIRDHDPDGSIVLVGAEPDAPYARPPLSKALWQGKDEETVWRGTAELGVELRLGTRIVQLDLDERTAVDDRGEPYGYERLLIATGGRPRRLPDGAGDGNVIYFRTLATYRQLRALAEGGGRFVVIGGGFIGSEIAAALSSNGCAVSMVFPETGIGARLFPSGLASFVTEYYRDKGVDVFPGDAVDAIVDGGVRLGGGRELEADGIVAGLGIEPAVDLAEAAGLEIDDGVVVDDRGRAGGREDVFAAGDVARFPAKALGTLFRVEHEDHANSHGRHVGANMAGADQPYDHLPFFYSDLFELGYEAVGELDSRLEIAAEWVEPNRKGVVCYLDGERRPRGFLLWDVWGKTDAASELIAAAAPLEAEELRTLLD